MRNRPTSPAVLLSSLPLLLSSTAMAQHHEPMLIEQVDRYTSADAGRPTSDLENYAHDEDTSTAGGAWGSFSGVEYEDSLAPVPSSHASAASSQLTTATESYLGGFFRCQSIARGFPEAISVSNMEAFFVVERTGLLRIRTTAVGASHPWSHLLKGATIVYDMSDLTQIAGLSDFVPQGESIDAEDEVEILIRPGRYWLKTGVSAAIDMEPIDTFSAELDYTMDLTIDRLPDCGDPAAGACDQARETPSCQDASCCDAVCVVDPFCCENAWDDLCVERTGTTCVSADCDPDLNGDGAVDGADQGLLFAAWGPQSPTFIHPADLNGDMVVNGEDLGLLMAEWGDC